MRLRQSGPEMVLSAIGSGAIVLAIGCHEPTDPLPTGPPPLQHPMVGTYELTTTLTKFYYASLTTRPPYRQDSAVAGPAALFGTITVGNSVVPLGPGTVQLPLFSALLYEVCADAVAPCDAARRTNLVEFHSNNLSPAIVSGDSIRGELGSEYHAIGIVGTFSGDSIAGELGWQTKLGPASRGYRGTFVARRRR